MSHNDLRPLLRYALENQDPIHSINTGGTHEEERTRDYRHHCFQW